MAKRPWINWGNRAGAGAESHMINFRDYEDTRLRGFYRDAEADRAMPCINRPDLMRARNNG